MAKIDYSTHKISDLMALLESIQKEHGDLKITYWDQNQAIKMLPKHLMYVDENSGRKELYFGGFHVSGEEYSEHDFNGRQVRKEDIRSSMKCIICSKMPDVDDKDPKWLQVHPTYSIACDLDEYKGYLLTAKELNDPNVKIIEDGFEGIIYVEDEDVDNFNKWVCKNCVIGRKTVCLANN